MDLQGIWDAIVRFCEDNSIWLLIGGELAAILIAVNAIKKDGRAKRKREDAWMQGFEARMEAFEKNEDPLMPVRKPLLSLHREQTAPEETTAAKTVPEGKNVKEPMSLNVKIRIEQMHITGELAEELAGAVQQGKDRPPVNGPQEDTSEPKREISLQSDTQTAPVSSTASGRSGRVYSEEELRKLIRK